MHPIEVTTRVRTDKVGDAVAEEAEKGFDLLLIGMDKVLAGKEGFDRKIENLADGFKGPIAIVAAKGFTSNNRQRPSSRSWCLSQGAPFRGAAPKSPSLWRG